MLDRVLAEHRPTRSTRADALVQRLRRADQPRPDRRVHRRGRRRPSTAVREVAEPYLLRPPARARRARRPAPGRARPRRHPPGAGVPARWPRSPDRDGETAVGLARPGDGVLVPGLPRPRAERDRAGPPGRRGRRHRRRRCSPRPGIRLRNAVALDHHGDTDGCLRVLRDIDAELARYVGDRRATSGCGRAAGRRTGTRWPRRAALGEPPSPTADAAALLADGGDGARARDLRQLGEVCLAIAAGRPDRGARPAGHGAGVRRRRSAPAEPARLRSLCHAAAGDHAAAHRGRPARVPARRPAHRPAARRLPGRASPPGWTTRRLRRDGRRYEDEALTDPLTGLPNRRQLERYVAGDGGPRRARRDRRLRPRRLQGGQHPHGHHSGDLVLQRVAGVINRVMRRGDFVARYGGDEFVVVLPGAGMAEAAEVARRISAAVAGGELAVAGARHAGRGSVGWSEVGAQRPYPARGAGGRGRRAAHRHDRDRCWARSRPGSRPRQDPPLQAEAQSDLRRIDGARGEPRARAC